MSWAKLLLVSSSGPNFTFSLLFYKISGINPWDCVPLLRKFSSPCSKVRKWGSCQAAPIVPDAGISRGLLRTKDSFKRCLYAADRCAPGNECDKSRDGAPIIPRGYWDLMLSKHGNDPQGIVLVMGRMSSSWGLRYNLWCHCVRGH